MAAERRDYRRVVIEACRPVIDGGLYPAKGSVGLPIQISAEVFAHGHDAVLAWVRWGPPRGGEADPAVLPVGWREEALTHGLNDYFSAWITPTRVGDLSFDVVGAIDDWGSCLHAIEAKFEDGQDVGVELEEGARMAAARAGRRDVGSKDRGALRTLATTLRDSSRSVRARVHASASMPTRRLMERTLDRTQATLAGPFGILVDRPLAAFSAWYELFPRSEGAVPPRSGTLEQAARRLDAIAAMGFDVVYLPPIHPIGTTFRKGINNSLTPTATDVGSPWAIGGPTGGHTAVHPDIGTLADFDAFVARAGALGLEVALDYALQCSPNHPWVSEHPEWFNHRPDGTIKYAENPPKKYQDIYPINFETRDRVRLWNALRDVLLFWCERGIRVFRVDNPHTKPMHFWRWVIADVRRRHPGTIFLAEAFTRPTVMHHLAKAGFTQSYTYFTWRSAKWELTEYLSEISSAPGVDHFRPNFWPNTPDILPGNLQSGGPAAFRLRLILAAFGAGSWGMYSGYELYEDAPVRPGSEEYDHSEKYELRPRNWLRPDSLEPLIARVNEIRRRHRAAVAQLGTLRIHHIDGDSLLCFSRSSHDRADVLLVVVNLDPHSAQSGSTWLDLEALGLSPDVPYEAHDELTNTTYVWHGPANYVHLDPASAPAHILHLRKR